MILGRPRGLTLLTVCLIGCGAGATVVASSAVAATVPTVASVAPTSGRTAGAARVTVRGTYFSHVTSVRFGTAYGTSISVISSTALTVTTPAHAAGAVDVRVVTTGGASAVRTADRYVYVAPPTVTSIAPTGGLPSGSAQVTVRGANFTVGSRVLFGSTYAPAVHLGSSTQLVATSPARSAGLVDVRVVTPYGTSATVTANHFTYRDAPDPVTALAVQDLTGTTATLRWTPSDSTGLAGVMIRRLVGSTAPASPASGTLVATVTPATPAFIDTTLARSTTYSYALFAYSSAGPLYSTATSMTLATPANARPDVPTAFATSPQPASGDVCSGSPYTSLAALGGGNLTLGVHMSDPDGNSQFVKARFRLWDLGGSGTDVPTDVVARSDAAGTSSSGLGGGSYGTVYLPGSLLTDGHLYGVDALVDDGTAQSATSEACHFWYDASPPNALHVTSPDSSFHTGTPAHFDLSASEVSPASGRASGFDRFVYSTSSTSDLPAGTPVTPTVVGNDASATLTLTPTVWGTNYLYVQAVDKAGNRSSPVTFSYYVASN